MALQRKNFRCPREGFASPVHTAAGGSGVVISHAELPPRQRKRLQVGATNISKSDLGDNKDDHAAQRICVTNTELLMAALRTGNSDPDGKLREPNAGSTTGDPHVIRTEQQRLRSMTPSSTHANENPTPLTQDERRQEDHAGHQKKQHALFLMNRRRLYEAFVEKYGSMRAVFKAFDSDGDGVISFQRFSNMVEASEVGLTPEETCLMYAHVDTNGDNAMEFQEFAQMFTATELHKDTGCDDSEITRDPSSSLALKYRSPLELSPRSREKMKELRAKVTEQLAKKHGLDVSVHGGKDAQLLMFASKQFDADNDGVLTYEQARNALGKDYLKLQMHPTEMEEMIRMIDRNGDELISMKEFVQYFGVGKREIPTDLVDSGRKKALVALHQKMDAKLTPREEFDPEYFESSESKRIAAAAIFQTSPLPPTRLMSGSKSVPTLGSLRASDRGGSRGGSEVNPITPVSQDRFLHRRMERTDWTRVGLGGDGVVRDSGLLMSDHDRFRTTTVDAYSPMKRGVNSGDLHRDQLPTSTIELEVHEKIRQAHFERTQNQLQLMDANRVKEERLKDWKMRANVRKTAGQKFVNLDRIHDQEQRAAMKDMQMQKRHGGARYLRVWAGCPDSQFNSAGEGNSREDPAGL